MNILVKKVSTNIDNINILDVKTSDSPVGFPGEHHRYFLSDEGYKNAKASEGRGKSR